jgi:DNA-binding transcriptional regulator YhcF (GntR family)
MSAFERTSHNNLPSVLRVLRERIAGDLDSGVLEHGDRLPSVREVGEELGADPRIVLAAYQQLVEEGLVEVRSRSGVFVTGAYSPEGDPITVPRRWILETLHGAIERDIPPLLLVEHIRSALSSRRMRVAILECNDDQLHSMREELHTYFGVDAVAIALDTIDPSHPPRELRDVDLLVSAGHDEIVAQVAAAVQKPYVITRVRPALVARLSRLLARGPVYFLVADPRFGAKMRRLVAPMARSENLHVLLVDTDDLRVIPAGAPTYVMRSAKRRLTGKCHLGREIPQQRIFSEEASREILSRILGLTEGASTSIANGPLMP